MNGVAKFISVIFHPLFMPTYLCVALMIVLPAGLDPLQQDVFLNFLVFIFLVTFVFPTVFILVFKLFGTIPSYVLEERRDRILPFTFIAVLYVSVTVLFYLRFGIDLSDNIMKFMMIIDMLVIGALVVTIFYKISVHALGICGIVGVLIPLNSIADDGSILYASIITIILAGVVMSARLKLQAHTPREVMFGSVLGFMISFMSVVYLF